MTGVQTCALPISRLATHYKIAYSPAQLSVYEIPSIVGGIRRQPECPDTVGAALEELRCDVRSEDLYGFEKFLEQWHRQRMLTFLRLGDFRRANAELPFLRSDKGRLLRLLVNLPMPCRQLATSLLNAAYFMRYAVRAHN